MDKIPTAEEFLNNHKFHLVEHEEYISTVIIEFAKLHVEAALKQASENAESIVIGGLISEVNKDSILNAYPLENIK